MVMWVQIPHRLFGDCDYTIELDSDSKIYIGCATKDFVLFATPHCPFLVILFLSIIMHFILNTTKLKDLASYQKSPYS